ncbi:MAG TPA: hypothetical protein VK474_10645 [Chthoniobacterales bacterium]|nr:hypothetical protein [Chthoniobacterales bacterium]
MKKLLMVSNGDQLAARIVKAVLVLLTTLAFGTMFWVASTPLVQAQNMSPAAMIGSQLPQGSSAETASKADFLAAVAAAVKKYRSAAPAIVRFAIEAHPEWKKDILRAAFAGLGSGDCRSLARVLRAAIAANPDDASELTDLATQLAPNCASAFAGAGTGPGPGNEDEGNFGNVPLNQNPPPGSVGGGGGQGNVIAVCFNGVTRFFSPEGAEEFINGNPGASLGACQVTPVQNR